MLPAMPKILRPKRAKQYKKPKGRAPTETEFKDILKAVPEVVGKNRAPSWQHFLRGLWWSGLRLGEALELWWNRQDRLCIDLSGTKPVLRIPADLEKGHQDRLLPIAPEFTEFLLETPPDERTGRVFTPEPDRVHGEGLTLDRVSRVISIIGEKAGVVVHIDSRTGKMKYASAHDFRRAFGDRWALRVMPPVLMQLMRHESIETTMKYYVGRSVEATTEVLWEAYLKEVEDQGKKPSKRDTLRDTTQGASKGEEEQPDTKPKSKAS
jgi:integrase